jgi:hypothetical protein
MRPAVVWSNIFNRVFLSCACKELSFEERTVHLKVHVYEYRKSEELETNVWNNISCKNASFMCANCYILVFRDREMEKSESSAVRNKRKWLVYILHLLVWC